MVKSILIMGTLIENCYLVSMTGIGRSFLRGLRPLFEQQYLSAFLRDPSCNGTEPRLTECFGSGLGLQSCDQDSTFVQLECMGNKL